MMANFCINLLGAIGQTVRDTLGQVGFAIRSFVTLLRVTPGALRRPALISEQIHFIGNYSLVIIIVSVLILVGIGGLGLGALVGDDLLRRRWLGARYLCSRGTDWQRKFVVERIGGVVGWGFLRRLRRHEPDQC